MMQLYNYYRSSASFRVRIVLNLKNIEHELIPINLLNEDQLTQKYTSINPQGLVPTLIHQNNIITQSLAIIEYLEELHPTPPLLPNDPIQKAKVRAFSLGIGADVHPLNNVGTLRFLTQKIGLSEDQKNNWYQHWVKKGLTALEQMLVNNKETHSYCFGEEPSMADVFLVPQIYNARRFSCDLNNYPTLTKIDAHCQKHPAFMKAWPVDAS